MLIIENRKNLSRPLFVTSLSFFVLPIVTTIVQILHYGLALQAIAITISIQFTFVVDTIENNPSQPLKFTYDDNDDLRTKIEKVAKTIYGAASVTFAKPALNHIKQAEALGMNACPVCIAKTQFSFSADAKRYGAVEGFDFLIRDVVLNAGAEMVVAIAGDILRMPGLPRDPQANHIDYVDGEIIGLS